MAIPDYARANFETLLKAARAGDLALMECTEALSIYFVYIYLVYMCLSIRIKYKHARVCILYSHV